MKDLILVLVAILSVSLFKLVPVAAESALPLKMGFISASSGNDPNTALEIKRGLDIFLSQDDKTKKRFAVSVYDNKGDVKETVDIVNKLADSGVNIVTGIARSDEAIAAAQIAKERGLLFLTPFATNSKLSRIDYKVIQVCYSDEYQAKALAKLVSQDLKPKSILILVNSESLYSTGLTQAFLAAKANLAGVNLQQVDYTEKDLKQKQIEEMALKLKPDLIFIPDHITRAAIFAKSLNKLLPKVKFLGGDGFGGKKILTGVFGDTPNIELYYTTHWHPAITTAANKKFVAAYKKQFPTSEPTSGAAMMFDLMTILNRAVIDGHKTPDDLANYIRTHKFESTTGTLNFSEKLGESVQKPVVVLRLKDSQYGFLKTYR